jgi:hypothetical protein
MNVGAISPHHSEGPNMQAITTIGFDIVKPVLQENDFFVAW